MLKETVYHRSKDKDAYVCTTGELHIQLWAKKEDLRWRGKR
ncbi:alpha amylase N-terminal ig-like domain-containing protein [Neobacillus sp. OS1-32]